jgi:hypothetical protein
LLDPYLQGGGSGTRLLQALPLQLTAASVDLAHTLLQHGLVQAVGRVSTAQVVAQSAPQQPPQQQQQSLLVHSGSLQAGKGSRQHVPAAAAAGTGGVWCGVLCQVMDVPQLYPVRRLAKQVVVDVCGSSARYKEVRSLHLLSKQTSQLLQTLGLPQQQQQQQGPGGADGVLEAAAAAVSALQDNWQQQCAVAACLAQLLTVAEAAPVCWAHLCSSSSSSSGGGGRRAADRGSGGLVLPLLMQLALGCQLPQLSLPAVKLFNAALTGVVRASSSSSSDKGKSSSATSSSKAGGSTTGDAPLSTSSSSSSSGSKGGAMRVPGLVLTWLLPQQQQQQQQMGPGPAVPPALLSVFIDRCVVGWPEVKERKEAAKLLVLLHKALATPTAPVAAAATAAPTAPTAAAAGSPQSDQDNLLQAVLQAVPSAGPCAGAAALQLYSAASHLLRLTGHASNDTPTAFAAAAAGSTPTAAAAGDGQGLSQGVSRAAGQLFATAAAAAAALAVHPCGLAYQQLQELMDLQQPSSSSSSTAVGYWLELSGCDVSCGRLNRKPSNTPVRLDSIAAELKFGDKQVGACGC